MSSSNVNELDYRTSNEHAEWDSRDADQRPDLQNILRQSYDYLTIMPKLPSTYDGRLIYKTSYNEWKAFRKNEIHVHNRNIVGDSVHKLAYDIPEKFQHVLSHYRKSILRQTYDNRIINRKIFCKSGPRSPIRYVDLMEFRLLRARD